MDEQTRGREVGAALHGIGAEAAAPVPAMGWTEAGLALMVVIWGLNFAVAKWALGAFHPLGFNALRYALASLFVYVVLRSRGSLRMPHREDFWGIAVLGFVGNVLYQMGFILGLDRTRAGNASLMLALMPVFVLVLGAARGERQGGRAWGGAAVSMLGVVLVTGSSARLEGGETLVGDLIVIAAAAMWAVYTVGAKPLIEKYGSVQTTAWTLWVGAVGLVLIGVPSLIDQDWGIVTPMAWLALVFSACFSIGLSYLLWYRGVAMIGGARTAIYSNLTPIVAIVAGAAGLDERLTPATLAGAAMVVGGVMLVRKR